MKRESFENVVRVHTGDLNKGITLVALVITIVILIILASISINMIMGNNGLFNRTKTATEKHNKQTATESINLKITTCQISTYAETQKMPTLKELAVALEKDNEIQYVNGSQRVASTQDINFTTATSIFTKLKAYPYEFEINSSLQLASIDGIQIASVPVNDDDTIVSMTKAELKKMIQDEISAATSPTNTNNNYSTEAQEIGTWKDGKTLYKKDFYFSSNFNGFDLSSLNFDYISIDWSTSSVTLKMWSNNAIYKFSSDYYVSNQDFLRVFIQGGCFQTRIGSLWDFENAYIRILYTTATVE